MDDRWKCPSCGFLNDYDEMQCVSCDTPQPDETLTSESADEPTDGLVFTSYLRDLDYKPKPLDLPLYAPRPDFEETAEPTPSAMPMLEPMPMPTLEPVPPSGATSTPASTKTRRMEKTLKHLTREKSPTPTAGQPPARSGLAKLIMIIAIAGIAAAIATSVANRNTSTSAPTVPSLPTVTTLPIIADPADNAYFEELSPINVSRNVLVEVTNERWDAWLELDDDGFPTTEYLVVDELATFQAEVSSMTPPVSDEVLSLHDTWTADLESLVLAEHALAAQPDQATLDAELAAWQTENTSYTALYEYMQTRQ